MISKFKYPPPLKVCSTETPWKNKIKYLGLTINQAVRWKPAIEERRTEAYAPIRKLYPLLVRNSSLPIRLKNLLYLICVQPILTYGVQLWGWAPRTTLNILQSVQNSYLRLILKKKVSASVTQEYIRWPTFLHSKKLYSPFPETLHFRFKNTIIHFLSG